MIYALRLKSKVPVGSKFDKEAILQALKIHNARFLESSPRMVVFESDTDISEPLLKEVGVSDWICILVPDVKCSTPTPPLLYGILKENDT